MARGLVIAAPNAFKGTATASKAAAAIGHACWEVGLDCVEIPMSDGGDGLIEVLGGANRTTTVTGPLGDPIDAAWQLRGGTAVIEMATASGLVAAGGTEANDPIGASTTGTGELIGKALDAGATRIIVGLGGSATTDGGLGAMRAVTALARARRVEIIAACDVETTFLDAAEIFAPQKGATAVHVKLLTRRLERIAQMYSEEFQIDVRNLPGSGAAGGLGGALAALGARLTSGVELVADELDLFDHLEAAELIITGEGRLDATSFAGKVVGGVAEIALDAGVRCVAIVGDEAPGWRDDLTDHQRRSAADHLEVMSMSELVGNEHAIAQPLDAIETAARLVLTGS